MKEQVSVNWIDDVAAMAVADRLGLKHTTMLVSVDEIDRKKSAENRARDTPLDRDRLDGLKHSMEEEIPVPKIFIRVGSQSIVIAGGNHRFNSLPAGVVRIPVHAVECTDVEFEVFCSALNTVVGSGLTASQRMSKAVDAVERLGLTRVHAASIYGLHVKSVEGAIRKRKAETRIAALAPGAKGRMLATHCVKMGELAANDNVLKAAADFVGKSKCSTNDFADLVAEAKTKTTEADQVAVFEAATAPYNKGKAVEIPRIFKKKFLKALSNLESFTEKRSWQQLEFQANEISAVKERLADLQAYLSYLCKANG